MQLKDKYDVVVVGAGIAGVSAAIRAGSMGAKVLLVEHYPFLGGMSAAGMVSPFMKSVTNNIELVKGVFKDLEKGMLKLGGMIDNGFYAWAFRTIANKMLWRNHVDVAYNADLIRVNRKDNAIESIELATRFGTRKVFAKQYIDTSGDGQLVALGNFAWEKGDVKKGQLQALTLFFRMGGIDVPKTGEYAKQHPDDFLEWMDFEFDYDHIISIAGYKGIIDKAKEEGRLDKSIPYIFFTSLPSTGEGSFNTSNIIGIDPSTSGALTKAEKIGHKQVAQVVDLLNAEVPGFENAYLIDTGIQVGVRETRRAVADYMMNGEDVMKGARFDDAIARGCYGIDIHGQVDDDSRMEDLGEGFYYEIPLRSLLVKEAENVMVAGRCIGATREGHSAIRIMPTAAATGEACGAVAALASKKDKKLREVDYANIRKAVEHNIENE